MSINEKLQEILGKLDGYTGVYARRLDSDEAIEVHADRSYALASVVKLPLLIHILRLVDQGQVSLDTRVTLHEDDRVAGSGVIQFLDPGLQPTVHDLMRLMMIVSDNEATDLLLNLTSKEAVEADMHGLGYGSFRMPHSIREMLASFLVNGENATYDETRAAFRDADRELPDDPAGNSIERGDRATPRDLAAMLVDLHDGKLASADSTEVGMQILKDCQTNSRLPAQLPKGTVVGHKTGTLNKRTNDAGIVFGPSGPYVAVLMNHGHEEEAVASATLAEASRAIFDHFEAGA